MTATTSDLFTPRLLETLRAQLRGPALTPGDDGYDAARRAWNLNADHRPALVVLAEDAYDVRTAVRLAGSAGLGVGVLATGHGTGVPCDGGLLINTSRMRAVHVDPAERIARVSAGSLWDDVVEAAGVHGLAGLPGTSTKVGVVGYTLGGGFGWLGRRYGLAAHSVTRAEVVTADGELVVADPVQRADLFWGLKGGTGNLGIVTSLEFALHPVRDVYAGNLYYPLDRAGELLGFFAEWCRSVPLELTSAVTFRSFPPLASIPEPLRGSSLVALRGCFCGDPADGASLIDGARKALGPGQVDTFSVMPASKLAAVSMDPVDPLGALSHSELLRGLTPETIDALVDLGGPDAQSPLVMLEVRQLGGALSGPPDALSPMAHTDAGFSLNAIGITPTPEHAVAVVAHLQKLAASMRAHATGESYLNFLDLDGASPERIRAAYSTADWDRLVQLKATYDPQNLFRFNRNVAPITTDRAE
jgi:FAD/FMN-containing dehydrogenase